MSRLRVLLFLFRSLRCVIVSLSTFGRLVLVSAFAIVSGCGGSDPYATVPVTGVVTCNGNPVANGVVNFTPLPDQEGRGEATFPPQIASTSALFTRAMALPSAITNLYPLP